MRMIPRFGVLLLATSIGIFAQSTDSRVPTEKARSAPVLTIYFENDTFTGTDRHYTNGIKFSWLSADLVDWGLVGWRKTLVKLLPFVNRPDGQKNLGFAIGQNMYAPRNIEVPNPDPNDRPYAGWTYLELAFISKTSRFRPVLLDRTVSPKTRNESFINGPPVRRRAAGLISSATKLA